MKDEDQGINVKDIIKRNIASTRKDAAGLKRPRGPEGKPPEMGSGFMQKRKDAAAKLKSSRKELARQTENFITRTVGIMIDRIEEQEKLSLGQRALMAAKKRPGATVTKTDGGEVVEAPSKKKGGGTSLVAGGGKGPTSFSKPKGGGGKGKELTRDVASHQNFIGRTVEILAEKLIGNQKKLDVNKSGKLDAQDFKMLRSGKKKGK